MAGHKPLTLKTEKVLSVSFAGLASEGIGEETVDTLLFVEKRVEEGMDGSGLLWAATHAGSATETLLFCGP